MTKEKRGKGERETRKVVEAKFEVEILDEMESLEDDETDFQERSEAAEWSTRRYFLSIMLPILF